MCHKMEIEEALLKMVLPILPQATSWVIPGCHPSDLENVRTGGFWDKLVPLKDIDFTRIQYQCGECKQAGIEECHHRPRILPDWLVEGK